jgi:hypothetical protein
MDGRRRILEETEVYETPEVEVYPREDNHTYSHVYMNDNDPMIQTTNNVLEIDQQPLRAADAFHAFLGRSLPPPKEEYKVAPRGELETPIMRYHRLTQEMVELERDLALLKSLETNAAASHTDDDTEYASILEGLKSLQANLAQLELSPMNQCAQTTDMVQVQQQLSAQLWKDLDALKSRPLTTTSAEPAPHTGSVVVHL